MLKHILTLQRSAHSTNLRRSLNMRQIRKKENRADADDAVEVTKKKRKLEGAVGKSVINYNFKHTGWYSDKSEYAQVYSPMKILEEESKRVHNSFIHMRVDWVALYPEVESFQDGEIDLMDLGPISIGKVYNWIIEEDKKETTSNYDMIHLMENESKVNIGCLNAESHNERMISVRNDVVSELSTLLSDDCIEMLVVLCINS